MKALVYTGPKSLDYRDTNAPELRPGELRIKVEAVGICGSDMHAFLGHDERRPAPLILGHEAAGTIADGPNAGQRVTVNPLIGCGSCRACQDGRNNICGNRQILSMPPREGAFSDYIAVPPENVVPVPHAVSFDKASLAEPMACGWHAVRLAEAAHVHALAECDCLVLGGGAIGVGAALSLLAQGAEKVRLLEPNPLRHRSIEEAGEIDACQTIDQEIEAGPVADIVVDAVGLAQSRAMASRAVRPGGVIVHIGLGEAEGGLDIRRMTLQEITFIGTYTYTPDDFKEAAQAIFDGRLGKLDWIETRPLSEGAVAFDDILNGRCAAPKIVLRP